MQSKRILPVISCFLTICLFTACSSGTKFASSFDKRKYTKGYFVDIPSHVKTHAIPAIPVRDITKASEKVSLANSAPNQPILRNPEISNTKSVPHRILNSTTQSNFRPIAKAEGAQLLKELLLENSLTKSHDTIPHYNDSSDKNFFAIAGLAVSIAGIVVTIINFALTPLAIVLMSLATIICVYSLFLNKIYYTFFAIVGLSLMILLVALIVA